MCRVALLHSNLEFGETLAEAAENLDDEVAIDVIPRIPHTRAINRLRRTDYDVIQADQPLYHGPMAAIYSYHRSIPFVLSFRGWADFTNHHGEQSKIREIDYRLRTKLSIRAADQIVTISEATHDHLRELYEIPSAETIGRTIDVDYYSNGRERPSDATTILSVTNLRYAEKLRGIQVVLDAMEDVLVQFPDVRYRIAGGGRYLPELRRRVSEHPVGDRIEVLGQIDDIADEYASADVFAYASFLDSYATVILEAQAAGLPVVASETMGIPEAVTGVRDGNTDRPGLLCDPTSDAFAEQLSRLLADDSLRADLGVRAERKMRHHNEEIARRYLSVWKTPADKRQLDPISGTHR